MHVIARRDVLGDRHAPVAALRVSLYDDQGMLYLVVPSLDILQDLLSLSTLNLHVRITSATH